MVTPNKKPGLLLLFVTIFAALTSPAQKRLVIGTLEPNYFYEYENKPLNIIGHFEKKDGNWTVLDEKAGLPPKMSFSVFYNARKLGLLQTRYNKTIDTTYYTYNWYKITSGNPPRVGQKTNEFAGWIMEKVYRPLVAGTMTSTRQKINIKKMKGSGKDSLLIENFLQQKASEMQLGEIPFYGNGIVSSVSRLYVINDNCSLIEASLNLNIYCFSDSVRFADAATHEWPSVEKSMAQGMDGQPLSTKVLFLKKGNTIKIIGRNLILLDHADYDNDGDDEIIFQQHLYNYDGYIMIVNNYSDAIRRGWSYH